MSVATQGRKENTSDLALTARERDELRLALSIYVTDLKMEIVCTDRYEFREELKGSRAVLEGVLRRLGGAGTTVAGPERQGETK